MKYCVSYNRNFSDKFLNEIDEINVKCYPTELITLFQFIEEHALNQQINIQLFNSEMKGYLQFKIIDKLIQFAKEKPEYNICIVLPDLESQSLEWAKQLKDEHLKFYFRCMVKDWEEFTYLIYLGVSSICLIEQICFDLINAARVAHEHNVNIRVFPHIAQVRYKNIPDIKAFFIRPEDIEIYEPYVDVCEFLPTEQQNEEVLYDIYAKDKKWYGNLKDLILGFTDNLDSKYIIPKFAERRISCDRKCLKGLSCTMCENIIQLSQTLQKAGIQIKKEVEKDGNKGINSKETSNE